MTDKPLPPKITPAPDVGKYDAPSEGLFGDVLGEANKTAAFNETIARDRREREKKKQQLRDKLDLRGAEDQKDLLARFGRQVKPLLDVLEGLPDQDGKFIVEVKLSSEGIDNAVAADDETKYRGPRLQATVTYTGPGLEPSKRDGKEPAEKSVIGIDIYPDRTLPQENIRVTRYDVVTPSYYGQGGAGPDDYSTRDVSSYTDLRREIGKWLGNVAPSRLAEITEAGKLKVPKPVNPPKLGGIKPAKNNIPKL